MIFVIRKLITVAGLCIVIVSGILFVERQETSGAYFILTQRMAAPPFLSYQLYLPDGHLYHMMPPDFGAALSWSPAANGIFNQGDDGLYIYDVTSRTNRQLIEANMPTIPVGTLPADYFFFPTLVLSPDQSSYLFQTDSAVYHFDTSGKNVEEIFTTSGTITLIAWDGEWAIVLYAEPGEQRSEQVEVNINDLSKREPPEYMPFGRTATPYGVFEITPEGWRVYPRNSTESILLDSPEGVFSVVNWLTEELLLVSEADDYGPDASYNLYLMDIYTQELRKIAQPEGAGIPPAAAFKDGSLYTYSTPSPTQQYSTLLEVPFDGGEPSVILENCYAAVYFDTETHSARRWQGEPTKTIFLATEAPTYRAFYRYGFGDDTAEMLFKTNGLAGRGNVDLSPDFRSLIISYQDRGGGIGHFYIVTIDLEDGRAGELVQDHALRAVSPLIDGTAHLEVLVVAGILLSGMGLYKRR